MSDLIDCFKKAEEVYNLGLKMFETFGKEDADKRSFMIMAIAAGIKGSSTYQLAPVGINPLGSILKSMRQDARLTLRQIEDATGISNSYLSQLENGKITNPSKATWDKIINFINSKNEGQLIHPLPNI